MCIEVDVQTKRMFFAGQVAFVLASVMQFSGRHYPQFHPDLMDGVHGLFIGVAIATMLLAIRRGRRHVA